MAGDAATTRLPAARRRRQLLDAALAAFSTGGYHGTSMDEVATAAGVTKPVLYQHFGSKRELYAELLDDVGGQLLEAIGTAAARAGHPRRQVQAGFAAYFAFVAEHQSAFRLLFGGGSKRDEAFAGKVRQVERAIAELVASMITADVEPGRALLLAQGVVGMAEATCRHWLADRTEGRPAAVATSPDELAEALAELAWGGLRGVGGGRAAGRST